MRRHVGSVDSDEVEPGRSRGCRIESRVTDAGDGMQSAELLPGRRAPDSDSVGVMMSFLAQPSCKEHYAPATMQNVTWPSVDYLISGCMALASTRTGSSGWTVDPSSTDQMADNIAPAKDQAIARSTSSSN